MSDLISRRAAIEAIFNEPLYESGMKKRGAEEVVPAIFEKIKALPSVQPEPSDVARNIATIIENEKDMRVVLQNSGQSEIIYCKDCKHRGREGKPIADGRYWCELHNAFMYYCSDAERRSDE